MNPSVSIIIPAHNEEAFIGPCLEAVGRATERIVATVETVVVANRCIDRTESIAREFGAVIVHDASKNLSRIRNAGVRASQGSTVITVDADSVMAPSTLVEVERALGTDRFIGGGVWIQPERLSPGIIATGIIAIPWILFYRISCGLFWFKRRDFDAIGGFDERLCSAEDIDFALRLKAYGRTIGKRYKTLYRASIRTSCRKFDHFGDWYFVRNPRRMLRLLRGKDQGLADEFWYDFNSE